MNPKNKRTLFLTSTICIILSIVAFALSHMGGASNENYILLYVIAVLLNIVLNLALSIKIASTNGAKALVSLGKWIMPIAGVVYLIPQVYSVLFPAKTMQDTYWYHRRCDPVLRTYGLYQYQKVGEESLPCVTYRGYPLCRTGCGFHKAEKYKYWSSYSSHGEGQPPAQ